MGLVHTDDDGRLSYPSTLHLSSARKVTKLSTRTLPPALPLPTYGTTAVDSVLRKVNKRCLAPERDHIV